MAYGFVWYMLMDGLILIDMVGVLGIGHENSPKYNDLLGAKEVD